MGSHKLTESSIILPLLYVCKRIFCIRNNFFIFNSLKNCVSGLRLVPVLPKENEVSLIVEGDNFSSIKLWIVREQGSQHACYHVANTSREVVQHHLGIT